MHVQQVLQVLLFFLCMTTIETLKLPWCNFRHYYTGLAKYWLYSISLILLLYNRFSTLAISPFPIFVISPCIQRDFNFSLLCIRLCIAKSFMQSWGTKTLGYSPLQHWMSVYVGRYWLSKSLYNCSLSGKNIPQPLCTNHQHNRNYHI